MHVHRHVLPSHFINISCTMFRLQALLLFFLNSKFLNTYTSRPTKYTYTFASAATAGAGSGDRVHM